MIDIFRKILKKNKSTDVGENLRYYTRISDLIVSAGLFSMIFSVKLNVTDYFGSANLSEITDPSFLTNLLNFLNSQWLLLTFALFVFIWYLLYKIAVKNETEILVRLYSQFNPPQGWEELLGQKWVPVLSVGITLAFLAMAWFIDDIMKFCLIMLLLNLMDVRGNNLMRQNLTLHFENKKHIPLDSDLHKAFIMRRREVAKEYWIWKPQIERITIMIIFTLVAFTLASSELTFGFKVWPWVPYLIIIFTIIGNEYTMGIWRSQRDQELDLIEENQNKHEQSLMNEIK